MLSLNVNYVTEGEDFQNLSSRQFNFSVNSSTGDQFCVTVVVLEDLILEPNQTFSIVIRSEYSFVNTVNSTISIIDNDCKLINIIFSHCHISYAATEYIFPQMWKRHFQQIIPLEKMMMWFPCVSVLQIIFKRKKKPSLTSF